MNSEDALHPSEDIIMRKTLTLLSCISLISAAPVYAADSSKEENIGVGSGAIVGAIAGGPLGFIIGAAIGAKVGDTMRKKNASIDDLSVALQQSNSDLRTLNASHESLNGKLEHMQRVARPELVSMLEAGIAMDLLFRTDEHVLVDTTGDRLATLGSTLATMTDVRVQLDGFADERGDETYNYNLSAQRVEFVRDQLVAAGIHPSRIQISAHGEAPAQDASVDSYALERRVSLTLFIGDAQSVAQLP
jgi:outer membrane protein OmpA-like peptidoglycan-associated protein